MKRALAARPRVVLLSPGGARGQGGIGSYVRYLVEALPTGLPNIRLKVLDTYGPAGFWVMPLFFTAALVQLAAKILLRRIDVVHLHMACRGSAVRKSALATLALASRVPTVVHLHGSDFDSYFRQLRPLRRRLLSRVLRSCTRVVVVGSHWRAFAETEVGVNPQRVVLVHNGVPQAPAGCSDAPDGSPTLLTLGELGSRKGTPELITALASSALREAEWTAILAGSGDVTAFRAMVGELGLSERVSVLGWQDRNEVRRLMRRAAIFVLPSHAEGLPMAILEAMAAGVPVISTPVGAIPDAIIDGKTGVLVEPGNPPALARAIATLLSDHALRSELATNARIRYESMFTIERTAGAIADVYRALCEHA